MANKVAVIEDPSGRYNYFDWLGNPIEKHTPYYIIIGLFGFTIVKDDELARYLRKIDGFTISATLEYAFDYLEAIMIDNGINYDCTTPIYINPNN